MTDRGGRGPLRFRPTLWATVFALAGLAVLVSLGLWQVQRLHWKQALIAELEARGAAPAVAPPARIEDPAVLEFRRVRLAGRYLHERELYIGPRSYKRRPGYHVVTPFLLEDGRQILVDRGWVAEERRDPARRAAGQTAGRVSLEAVLRAGGWKGMDFVKPEHAPAQNLWHYHDLPAMASAARLDRPITELYAVALPGGHAEGPAARPPGVGLRNDHLEYAITWFALALALTVIYVIFHLRRGNGPASAP